MSLRYLHWGTFGKLHLYAATLFSPESQILHKFLVKEFLFGSLWNSYATHRHTSKRPSTVCHCLASAQALATRPTTSALSWDEVLPTSQTMPGTEELSAILNAIPKTTSYNNTNDICVLTTTFRVL